MKNIVVPFSMFLIKDLNGIDNVPKKGAFILASNHSSYLDPIIIPAIFIKFFKRKVHYLGKRELFETWIGKKIHNAVGTIPLDRERGEAALKSALKLLKEGGVIGIFPEGTRTKDGKLWRGKTGVARLALAAKVPVVPIGITGAFELMSTGGIFPKFKKNVAVNIGKPIYFKKYYGKGSKAVFREVTTIVMKEIAELSKQKYKP